MFRIKRKLLTCLTLLGIASWTQLAFADAQSTSPSVNGAVEASSAIAVSTADLPLSAASAPVARKLFAGKPVTAEVLAAKRGGDRVFNENQLKGVVADNHASNLTTGMNVITDGAFSGASGLPVVIQNSGNNVLIQNATIVNVQLK